MTSQLTVTPAQVLAAQLQLRLADEIGETVSPLVRAIAKAKVQPSAVSNGHAAVERSSVNGSASSPPSSARTAGDGSTEIPAR